MSFKRCFVSINLGREAILEIKKIQKFVKKDFVGKLTETKNLHLTLKFLGEIDENRVLEVRESLKKIKFKEFEAKFGKVGIFNENSIRIIWIELLGNIIYLQKEVDLALSDLFKKEKYFMSHITIARVKKVYDKNRLIRKINSLKTNSSFSVKKFYLMESKLSPEGPIYSVIEEYKPD